MGGRSNALQSLCPNSQVPCVALWCITSWRRCWPRARLPAGLRLCPRLTGGFTKNTWHSDALGDGNRNTKEKTTKMPLKSASLSAPHAKVLLCEFAFPREGSMLGDFHVSLPRPFRSHNGADKVLLLAEPQLRGQRSDPGKSALCPFICCWDRSDCWMT